MAILYNAVHRMWTDTRGQDLVEYALIAGFVAVAAGAIFPATLMPDVSIIFSKLGVMFTEAASQGS
jgi:Flp pilus assembly pilin Flp